MEVSSVRILKVCRHLVIWITIIGGAILWLLLPNQVPVHYGLTFTADRIGNKELLLVLFILPFFAYIPYSVPEFHLDSEENRLAIEKKIKMNALIQLITAIILSIIVWIPLLLAL